LGSLAAGAVVLVPFPFSDLSQSNLRPAVVAAGAGRGDWILCQVTSNAYADAGALPLEDGDFRQGGLRVASFARPTKLFTAHESLFVAEVGQLRDESLNRIIDRIIAAFGRRP